MFYIYYLMESSQQPGEAALLSSAPFYREGNRAKERASGMAKVTQLLNVCPGITYIFVVKTLTPRLLGHFGIPGVLSSFASWRVEAPKGFIKEPVSPRQPFCPIGKRSTYLVG